MKKEQKDGTTADSSTQPIGIPSANLAQNPLLAAVFCQDAKQKI